MVSCTGCVHYHACKVWAEHNEKLVYTYNNGMDRLSKIVDFGFKGIDHINFPLVAETKEAMCENYEKAKENV